MRGGAEGASHLAKRDKSPRQDSPAKQTRHARVVRRTRAVQTRLSLSIF